MLWIQILLIRFLFIGTSSVEVLNMVVNGEIGMVVYDFDGFVENPDTSYLRIMKEDS